MVALEAWYDSEDDEPTLIQGSADLDVLLDRMVADGRGFDVPPLAELSRQSPDGWLVAHVGLDPRRGTGFMTYADPVGSVTSCNGGTDREPVDYDYMGHQRQIPANAELPLADICEAVHELVATGGRPSCIAWQEDAEPGRSSTP
ncbi:Imm1 family immunity protein [Allokutzneria sp. A3M-2-11 16]|uniref:Imm1 family immunity protein n=1 Tax=Allokutzneria sp. A3M-2-11 16 TaxID=2962043 RepID=UPI0020B737E0|nr:Imm1 family immunity protein [Allokutzneria sp. A3M-2-11 16]MCP3805112.1 Imm1 family immunity protein [Allokutzneria sp. A3M-2-11 16]